MAKKEKSSNMTTILIILFVLLLIYFYSQSNIIEPVVQSAGNIDTLQNISRILKQF